VHRSLGEAFSLGVAKISRSPLLDRFRDGGGRLGKWGPLNVPGSHNRSVKNQRPDDASPIIDRRLTVPSSHNRSVKRYSRATAKRHCHATAQPRKFGGDAPLSGVGTIEGCDAPLVLMISTPKVATAEYAQLR